MIGRRRKRKVLCAFCAHFMESRRYGCWFCSLHNHVAEADDFCSFGSEADESEDNPTIV